MDEWNRNAVTRLLADAERALALVSIEDVRGSREIARSTLARAGQSYHHLLRRSRPLTMTGGQNAALHNTLAHLQAVLRFFGQPV